MVMPKDDESVSLQADPCMAYLELIPSMDLCSLAIATDRQASDDPSYMATVTANIEQVEANITTITCFAIKAAVTNMFAPP